MGIIKIYFQDNLDIIIENDRNKKIKALAEKSWEFISSNRKVSLLITITLRHTMLKDCPGL